MKIPPPDKTYKLPKHIVDNYAAEIEDLYPIRPKKVKEFLSTGYIVYEISKSEDGLAISPDSIIVPTHFYGIEKREWDSRFIQSVLYEKGVAELRNLTEELKEAGAAAVIERAYELVIKEEISDLLLEQMYDMTQVKFLLEKKFPLDYIYNEWLSNDYSIRELLFRTIDDIQYGEDFSRWRDENIKKESGENQCIH